MSILFLDIDGVLNRMILGAPMIEPLCIEQLNRILKITGCSVVLSSSWRNLLMPDAVTNEHQQMTLSGFAFMLYTHGVQCLNLIGHLEADRDCWGGYEIRSIHRGQQIRNWIRQNVASEEVTGPFCALDDGPIGPCQGVQLVLVNSRVGLGKVSADQVIQILGEKN